MEQYRIGDWQFDPSSGELARDGQRQRLEPRAARTLKLLCEAEGAMVPHERLIAEVWGGRSLSDNSVAVVIGQLRRALGDEQRRVIENVPKRGYRLTSHGEVAALGKRGLAGLFVVSIVAAIIVAVLLGPRLAARDVPITVADVVNETGNPEFGPHARATSELIVHELEERGFAVRRGREHGPLRFEARLVMWNGRPFLGMTATAPDGTVRWTSMRAGGPAEAPATTADALNELKRAISGS